MRQRNTHKRRVWHRSYKTTHARRGLSAQHGRVDREEPRVQHQIAEAKVGVICGQNVPDAPYVGALAPTLGVRISRVCDQVGRHRAKRRCGHSVTGKHLSAASQIIRMTRRAPTCVRMQRAKSGLCMASKCTAGCVAHGSNSPTANQKRKKIKVTKK